MSLSAPWKLSGESTSFVEKAIGGEFGGIMGGGRFGGGTRDDEIWNRSGVILGSPL